MSSPSPAKTSAKRKGIGLPFLLIVLLACPVAVAVVGVAAAVTVPAFIKYVRMSKTTEATTNLRFLYTGAATYYATEQSPAHNAPFSTSCTVASARTSNALSDEKTVVDWSTESASFHELLFTPPDPIYYQYEIGDSTEGCERPPNTPLYSFRARGDLDADGVTSLFELAVGSDANNELYRGAGFYIENETE